MFWYFYQILEPIYDDDWYKENVEHKIVGRLRRREDSEVQNFSGIEYEYSKISWNGNISDWSCYYVHFSNSKITSHIFYLSKQISIILGIYLLLQFFYFILLEFSQQRRSIQKQS